MTTPKTHTEPYAGFPRRVRVVPVPAPLLGSLLAQIDDMAELKCTLRAIALLSRKRGHPRFVTLREMQADESLANAMPTGEAAATNVKGAKSDGKAGKASARSARRS